MAVPDPYRLGGLGCARSTRGKLTAAERRRLLGAIAIGQAVNVLGRARLALGGLGTKRVPSQKAASLYFGSAV